MCSSATEINSQNRDFDEEICDCFGINLAAILGDAGADAEGFVGASDWVWGGGVPFHWGEIWVRGYAPYPEKVFFT